MAALKLLNLKTRNTSTFHEADGSSEIYTYACPCGKGTVKEGHIRTPDKVINRVLICCDECAEKYYVSGSGELRSWRLLPKDRQLEEKPLTSEELERQEREARKIAARTGVILDWPETVDWAAQA